MCSADSPGRSTLKTEAILIFDLDGTILFVNSFPYWVLYMLTGHFGALSRVERLALSLRTLQIMVARKLLGQSHYQTKRRLQALWARSVEKDASQAAVHGLIAIMKGYIRPNLRSLLAAVAGQHVDALLATSAAGEYALALGEALGFTHVLATPLCGEPDSLENRAERKRDRVLDMLAAEECADRMRILFTDHADDLPLIRECQRILWFGRDEDLAAIQASVPGVRIVACRNASEVNILRLTGSG